MPLMSDLARINRAFATLKDKGYEVSTTEDCTSCATSIVTSNKYVYYHSQDVEHLKNDNIVLGDTFYVGWGEDGNLDEICSALLYEGFLVIKPESTDYRIGIK